MSVNIDKDYSEDPWDYEFKYIDSTPVVIGHEGWITRNSVALEMQQVVTYDSWLGSIVPPKVNKTFLSVKQVNIDTVPASLSSDIRLLTINFYITSDQVVNKRVAYSVVDLLSDVGGLFVPIRIAF